MSTIRTLIEKANAKEQRRMIEDSRFIEEQKIRKALGPRKWDPGGRPKRKPIQEELEKVFEENPELARKIVYKAAMKAAQGDHKFFCEVRDMMDGKLAAPLFREVDSSTSVAVNIEVARKKLFGDDE